MPQIQSSSVSYLPDGTAWWVSLLALSGLAIGLALGRKALS